MGSGEESKKGETGGTRKKRTEDRARDKEKERTRRREAEEGDGNVPERWDTRDLCRWLSSEGGL